MKHPKILSILFIAFAMTLFLPPPQAFSQDSYETVTLDQPSVDQPAVVDYTSYEVSALDTSVTVTFKDGQKLVLDVSGSGDSKQATITFNGQTFTVSAKEGTRLYDILGLLAFIIVIIALALKLFGIPKRE